MFIQPDWFEVTKAGVGTNRYAYSGNAPVNISDPNGNCPLCMIPAIIGAYIASAEPANAPGPDDTPISQSPAQTITNMTAGAIGGKAAGNAIEMCAGACRAALHLGKTKTDDQGSIVSSDERPTHRQSEIDVGEDIGEEFRPEVSYKDGEEVTYGTPGSTRPDYSSCDSCVEVKNYDLSKGGSRFWLAM